MNAWILNVLKQIPCRRKVSDSVDIALDNQSEPVKGPGQASSAWPQDQNGKNGGHDTIRTREKKHSDGYKSVKNGHQRHNVTCSDKEDEKKIIHPEFEFFWLEDSPFSQWYRREFVVEGQKFCTAEQYMMYHKAKLFNDDETAKKILTEVNPRKQKKLGRQVKNFNADLWKRKCIRIIKNGNKIKFSQNEDLRQLLISTYPKTLVEASPYDRFWGIGLAASDPRAQTKHTWDGYNLLGFALTDVRNELMQRNDAPTCPDENTLIMINFGDEVESTNL